MSYRYRTLLGAMLVLGLLAMIGCGGAGNGGGDPLEGTSWNLSAMSAIAYDPVEYTITAAFAEGRMSGTGTVNSYSGPYTVGASGAFTPGEIARTLMAGPEPAQALEDTYFELLSRVRSYDLEGDILTLNDEADNALLQFVREGSG
ncbi:MAG: META domain-containing protein [Anaerolineae bacterium]